MGRQANLSAHDSRNKRFVRPVSTHYHRHPSSTHQDSLCSDVYVSWNGATQVSTYTLLAGTVASALTNVSSTPRSSFETHISMSEAQPFVAVVALASNGTELGRSGVVRVSNGTIVQDGSVSNGGASSTSSGSGGHSSNGVASLRNALWMSTVVGALLLSASVWLC